MCDMYYYHRSGVIFTDNNLRTAYEVLFGYYPGRLDPEYLRWLYSMLGKNIVKAIRADQMDLKELAIKHKVRAVMEYYRRTKCTPKEAREYIELLLEDKTEEKYTQEEYKGQFCQMCGSQRCEGPGTEMFDGCIHKNLLLEDEE